MKRFDALLTFIGANKKAEIIKIAIINVLIIAATVVITIFAKQILTAFVGLMILVGANYLLFSSYTGKKRQVLQDRESEFITIVGYLQFYISNSYNIYTAFKSVIPYSSSWMEEQINSLILEIDEDKTAQPFLNFANKFSSKVAANVMLTIYQMVEDGEDNKHMMQFDVLFQQINKEHIASLIQNKERKMGSICSFPLVGAGIITLLITFGIVSVMGDMLNVI